MKHTHNHEIVGEVVYYNDFFSHYLNNHRTIIVWLPPSYHHEHHRRYPVLYMHDGQNVFDPATSFAGNDWRLDETVSGLIKEGKLEEIIIVAIYNTNDRLKEYSVSEHGKKYVNFIAHELKFFIDDTFRTKPNPEHTAVMGSSMGGLISLYASWSEPKIFGKCAALSTSFWHSNEAMIKLLTGDRSKKRPIQIYLDSGDDSKYETQKVFCILTQKGYHIGDDIDYYFDRGADHNESAWANRLYRPLLFFFGK